MSFKVAKENGYDQCVRNNYYTICSSEKESYPIFLNYPVKFALAKFDNQQKLILIHIYMTNLPNYNNLLTQLSAEAHGSKISTDFISIAGSYENIFINTQESSIEIGDRTVIMNYQKNIEKKKLLDSRSIPLN